MPKRSTVPSPHNQDLVFKKVASGFFWHIRSDVLASSPYYYLNLSLVESIEVDWIDPKECIEYAPRTVYLSSGKTYRFTSPEQIKDLHIGLEALKKFVQGK